MAKFHGGSIADDKKLEWEAWASQLGFTNLWSFIVWCVEKVIRDEKQNLKK